MNARLTEIADIWKQNQWLYAVGGFLLGLLAYPGASRFITDLFVLLSDLVPEAVGIIITVFLIDRISEARAENREKQRRIRERNERLVRDIGSTIHEVAKTAFEEALKLKLLEGENGILKGAFLKHANLQEVDLAFINLEGAVLDNANLVGTYLDSANLSRASLKDAELQGACLMGTNFISAKMDGANLAGAELGYAKLQGASLAGASLTGTHVHRAYFDEDSRLPNGEKWTPKTDINRYTNPDHPAYWRPNYIKFGFEICEDWFKAGRPDERGKPEWVLAGFDTWLAWVKTGRHYPDETTNL